MAEATFQKQILNRLERVEKKMNYLLGHMGNLRLSSADKQAIRRALKEEKAGKLLSKKQVFG